MCSADCSQPVKALWGKREIGKFVAGATSQSSSAPTNKELDNFSAFLSDLVYEQNEPNVVIRGWRAYYPRNWAE